MGANSLLRADLKCTSIYMVLGELGVLNSPVIARTNIKSDRKSRKKGSNEINSKLYRNITLRPFLNLTRATYTTAPQKTELTDYSTGGHHITTTV